MPTVRPGSRPSVAKRGWARGRKPQQSVWDVLNACGGSTSAWKLIAGVSIAFFALILLFFVFPASSTQTLGFGGSPSLGAAESVLVAIPVDYSTVPAFLVAARSFEERARLGNIRIAAMADDIAWREIQMACPCYLRQSDCDRILRVPGESVEAPAKGSRRFLAEMSPRWSDPATAHHITAQLASLASCSASLVPESVVLVLPDPHFMVLGNATSLLQRWNSDPSTPPVVRAGELSQNDVVAGGMSGGVNAAEAEVLIVHSAKWRAAAGLWAKCPLNVGFTASDAAGQLQRAGSAPMEGVAMWQQTGLWADDRSFPPVGCERDPPTAGSGVQSKTTVMLRLLGATKPWEGDPIEDAKEDGGEGTAQSPSLRAGGAVSGGCGGPRTGVRHEAQRLLQCRYAPRPGMKSIDLERWQYTYYYRYFRNWFQPGPSRPAALPPGAMEDVRDPPRSDGNRFTDMTRRIGEYEGTFNYAPFADKAAVKHHARIVLGEGHTIDTFGVVTAETAPDFRPPAGGITDYAFKASNRAGMNAIVKKGKMVVCASPFLRAAAKVGWDGCKDRELTGDIYDYVVKEAMKRSQNPGREMQYSRMRKSMIIEKLYEGDVIPSDYKFFCSRGNIMFLKEVAGRFESVGKRRGYYLPDWTWLPDVFQQQLLKPAESSGPRPDMLEEMVKVAKLLSEPFPFVRIDLFQVNGRVYLGEMTYTPTAAKQLIEPPLIEETMGKIIGHHLPLRDPNPAKGEVWRSGLGPEGSVLSQEVVTEAMRPLSVRSEGSLSVEAFLEWRKKQKSKKA